MESAALAALHPIVEEEPSDPFAEFDFGNMHEPPLQDADTPDPFADFDFGDMEEFPSPIGSEPVSPNAAASAIVIDKTALFTRLQQEQENFATVMSRVATLSANAANCACPPTSLANGRVVHGNVVSLFAGNDSPSTELQTPAINEPGENRNYMVTEGCRPGFVHLYFPDGSYTEMTEIDAKTVMHGVPSDKAAEDVMSVKRYEKTLQRLGFDNDRAALLQAAYSMGAVQTGSHAHGAGCNHGGITTVGVPGEAAVFSFGGGGPAFTSGGIGTGGHGHENHDDHEHCSCGGHFHDGKCEKCGTEAKKAA